MITLFRGLGQGCPEGSSDKYTGTLNPAGGTCRCNPGWVWYNGYCQSPESIGQQAGTKITAYSGSAAGYPTQSLSFNAKEYFNKMGHTIQCHIDPNWSAGPQGGTPTMVCSIDGGPYEHAAYAVNQNPYTALVSAIQRNAAIKVSQQTGIPVEKIYSNPDATALLTKTTNQMVQLELQHQAAQNSGPQPQGESSGSAITDAINNILGGDGASGSGLDIFGSSVEILGYSVPVLALVAGGAALLYMGRKQ